MIRNKSDLLHYISEDCKANLGVENISPFILYIKSCYGSESAGAFLYLKALRKYEYTLNCLPNNVVGKLFRIYRQYQWRRLAFKYSINIQPNMIGCGFYMPHLLGGGIVINCKSIGYGCCCNINVLVGNKGDNDHVPTIGNMSLYHQVVR